MRLLVGISGASGVIMGYRLLQRLRRCDIETHLILSDNAIRNFKEETSIDISAVIELADYSYDNQDLAATVASGSFITDGMIVIPCSMKTLSGIANGFSANLLIRAADVCLKEGRKLVLVPREMPFSRLHLENLSRAAAYGCSILAPVLTFYNGLEKTEEQVQHILGKVLMQFGLASPDFVAWKEV